MTPDMSRLGWTDEMTKLREENARLRAIIKGVHGALTDAGTVVVPGSLDADLYEPVMRIVRERDEASAKAIRFDLDEAGIAMREKEAVELVELRAEVSRFRDEVVPQVEKKRHDAMAEVVRLNAEVSRLRGLLHDCVLHHSCEGYEEEGVCEHSRAATKGAEELRSLLEKQEQTLCRECGFWFCGEPSRHHSSCSKMRVIIDAVELTVPNPWKADRSGTITSMVDVATGARATNLPVSVIQNDTVSMKVNIDTAFARVCQLEAEVARLRGSLTGLLSYIEQLELLAYQIDDVDIPHPTVACARAALAAAEGGE